MVFRATTSLIFAVMLAGCGGSGPLTARALAPPLASSEGQTRPQARPATRLTAAPPPSETARTVEQFDTTSPEDRSEAASAPEEPEAERALGETVASLGDVAKPGFWLETPLVNQAQVGRVVFPETGLSSQVELLPIDGPTTGGSRISLAAMRLINAPLTGLPTLQVFAGN